MTGVSLSLASSTKTRSLSRMYESVDIIEHSSHCDARTFGARSQSGCRDGDLGARAEGHTAEPRPVRDPHAIVALATTTTIRLISIGKLPLFRSRMNVGRRLLLRSGWFDRLPMELCETYGVIAPYRP